MRALQGVASLYSLTSSNGVKGLQKRRGEVYTEEVAAASDAERRQLLHDSFGIVQLQPVACGGASQCALFARCAAGSAPCSNALLLQPFVFASRSIKLQAV